MQQGLKKPKKAFADEDCIDASPGTVSMNHGSTRVIAHDHSVNMQATGNEQMTALSGTLQAVCQPSREGAHEVQHAATRDLGFGANTAKFTAKTTGDNASAVIAFQ